jgi:arylsulfatase A-like enzyme
MPEFVTYPPDQPFPGVIGRTLDRSKPAWPMKPTAPAGAPNVVVIVLDDVGYGQLSAFGGLCETPNLDRLADRGLRYANFQTTALCSPTRAALLTGRNHHRLGMSAITELSMGFPAHNAAIGPEHGFISEVLVERGWNTFAVGKWHLTPPEETTPAGPFVRWPLGRGFERFYGFLGGDTDQWHPDLTYDNHWVRQPSMPEDGYHLNIDLADRAIEFINDAHTNAPDKPFFLYYCTGAGHAPHQVEPEWAQRYRGAFDMGWDAYRESVFARQLALGLLPDGSELSPRDPDVPAWETLSTDAQRMYARQMEVYAGFISQTDHHIGRVINHIGVLGELDNTLILAISDNGASAEGGLHGTHNEAMFFNLAPETLEDNLEHYDEWGGENTFNHYSWGWTWAGDTPFRRWKRETYRGGVTDPLIISWPAGITERGAVRQQYVHVTDIAPTIYSLLDIDTPDQLRGVTQSAIDGVSFAATCSDAGTPSAHLVQMSEMLGHRAIYRDGWKAICPYPGPSLAEGIERGHPFGTPITEELLDKLDREDWELYHLDADPCECHEVGELYPERLAELVELWWSEAERQRALPLMSGLTRLLSPRPRVGGVDAVLDLRPGSPISFSAVPRLVRRAHSMTADVTIGEAAAGMLLCQGNRHGGFAWYLTEGRLAYTYNYLGIERWTARGDDPIAPGRHELRMEFAPFGDPVGPGKGSPALTHLFVDGQEVASMTIDYTVPILFGTVGMSCGHAAFDTVDPAIYSAPFHFSGHIEVVRLDVTGESILDTKAEMLRIMTQQ